MPVELHDHKTGTPLNDVLLVTRMDEPDPANGMMAHAYEIRVLETGELNVTMIETGSEIPAPTCIAFQHGPIKEVGINGISNEALVAIVLDRLRGAQSGDFRCRENACAITHFEEGLHWLTARTMNRTRRGVEGRLTP
jgi:hypothetical protein